MKGSFKLGRSFEIGVKIALLPVTLDRLSKAWVVKLPKHFDKGSPWWQRHKFMLTGLAAFVFFTVLGQFVECLAEIRRRQSFSQGK